MVEGAECLRSALADLPEVGVMLEGGDGNVTALELHANDFHEFRIRNDTIL